MWFSVLLTTAVSVTCSVLRASEEQESFAYAAGECHNLEEGYYRELGCVPVETGSDGCIKSYDCGMIGRRAQNKCYFKGDEYELGQDLQHDSYFNVDCLAACRCEVGSDDKVAFNCVDLDCKEDKLNGPLPPGCYYTYDHGQCCSTGKVCHQTLEPNASTPKLRRLPACQYGSKEYQVGERFHPEDDPCTDCICQDGPRGVEPHCQKMNCNLELFYGLEITDGCIPVYYSEESCCPLFFRCPEDSGTEVVSVIKYNNSNTSDLQCQFGDVKMQVGDKLSATRDFPSTECVCRVPPHPVCILTHQKTHPSPALSRHNIRFT